MRVESAIVREGRRAMFAAQRALAGVCADVRAQDLRRLEAEKKGYVLCQIKSKLYLLY